MDIRIDIGERRSGKTARMLCQVAFDISASKIRYAILVFPNMAMLQQTRELDEKFCNGAAKLYGHAQCLWISADQCSELSSRVKFDDGDRVGIYFDEAFMCMANKKVYSDGRFNSQIVALVRNGGAVYFSGSTPENGMEKTYLETLTKMAVSEKGIESYDDGKVRILVKRLSPDARLPERAHFDDAGADVFAASCTYEPANYSCTDKKNVITYGTGLAMAIPSGYWIDMRPRSSVYKTGMYLCNSVGTIDAGYRGEVMAKFYSDIPYEDNCNSYKVGDKIAQLVVLPNVSPTDVEFVEVDELPDVNDRKGGFGSTGR